MAAIEITVDKLSNVYSGWSAVLAHILDEEGVTFRSSGDEVILVRHDGGTDTAEVVLVSTEDPYKRTKDITVTLNSGEVKAIGPVKQVGFMDSNGMVTLKLAAAISNTIVAYIMKPSD